jgi:uncharacterized membrane protein YccC
MGADIMSGTAALGPPRFVGLPLASWAFAVRIWIAIVVALYAAFWLELEAASSAAVCVAILAVPTRGQALEKAGFRFLATVMAVAASIAIVGIFSQARDLVLLAFAAWVGLCIFAAALSDGNRAYAAVLSGYTVGIIAIQQIDTPHDVFYAGMERGAAIAVGIAAIAIVNDLLVAPDRHRGLASQFAAIHRRVRDHAKAVIRGVAADSALATGLLRETAALRSEITSLATESSSGSARSAAARSTAVALVAEVHAVRILNALPVAADPAVRDRATSALEREAGERSSKVSFARADVGEQGEPAVMGASLDWALQELLRRDQEVREGLAALKSGIRPTHAWRMPFYRSYRFAAEAGVRAALWIALGSAFFVLAGWPATKVSLAQLAIAAGLSAATPNPREFTTMALIAVPIAAMLAGVLEFLILGGVTEFQLLALGLAPFVVGVAVFMTLPDPVLSAVARLVLIKMLVVLVPSNPQTYNPQVFLENSLFVCLAPALLLAAQALIPPVSDERCRKWLIASARRELDHLASHKAQRYSPGEAMFRDAVRIGQIAGTGGPGPQHRAVLEEALTLFDQAAMIRLCEASLVGLTGSPLAGLADQARKALITRDVGSIRRAASGLHDAADEDALAATTSGMLHVASLVLEEKGA